MFRYFTGKFALAYLVGLVIVAPAAAATSQLAQSVAAPPRLLKDDPLLAQEVMVEATSRPLGEVLSSLSPTLKVDLNTTREITDQRVTLHLTDQPLYVIMGRLVALLSHDIGRPHGYHWSILERPARTRPAYQLWRDAASEAEEADLRDYPRHEAAVLLRDLRNLSNMTPEQQAAYKGDFPYTRFAQSKYSQLYVKALKGLSDDQIDALVRGEAVALDPALYPDEIADVTQRIQSWHDGMMSDRQDALAAGKPDPYPNGIPESLQVVPTLTVTRGDEDFDGRNAINFGQYDVGVSMTGGGTEGGLILDTFDTNRSRDPRRVFPPASQSDPNSQIIDLTARLTSKAVTPAQRRDVGFTLQALAKEARINIYQEEFLRPSTEIEASDPIPGGPPAIGLPTLRGAVPTLMNAICVHWNYQYQKVGNDYLFWSRTWAIDRTNDVPERLIVPWQKKIDEQGELTLDDQAQIAAALTFPQIKLTLNSVLTQAPVFSQSDYQILRMLGTLTPMEREAVSGEGLALAAMPSWEQNTFAATFHKQLRTVNADQLDRATLTIQQKTSPRMKVDRLVLSVNVYSQPLFSVSMILPPSGRPTKTTNTVPK